ncbi:MAG: response regulator [Pseudoalteromonas distincta]
MKILLVEDDSFKALSISDYIHEECKQAIITIASSLVDAIDSVNNENFDLILVDMGIPSHPTVAGGGSPMSLLTGGLDVLLELNSLGRADPCLIITQYPEIEISGNFYPVNCATEKILIHLSCVVMDCILYIEGSSEWKGALKKALNTVTGNYENLNT